MKITIDTKKIQLLFCLFQINELSPFDVGTLRVSLSLATVLILSRVSSYKLEQLTFLRASFDSISWRVYNLFKCLIHTITLYSSIYHVYNVPVIFCQSQSVQV